MGGSCRDRRWHFSGFEHTASWASQGGPGGGKNIFQPFLHDSHLSAPIMNGAGPTFSDIPVPGLLPIPFCYITRLKPACATCLLPRKKNITFHFKAWTTVLFWLLYGGTWVMLAGSSWLISVKVQCWLYLVLRNFQSIISMVSLDLSSHLGPVRERFSQYLNLLPKSLFCFFFFPSALFIFISALFEQLWGGTAHYH